MCGILMPDSFMSSLVKRLTLLLWFTLSPVLSLHASEPVDLSTKSTVEVAPGVFSYGAFSARSVFVVTPEGVIVTDPVSVENARDMREAISEVTDQPVRYVIYSHQHWDHAVGAGIFQEEGAEIISHRNCLAHFERHPHPELITPDRTIKDSSVITLGGRTLRLLYLGPNHGDCMLIMQVEGTDVLYVNDLVTPHSVGLGFMPDYDPVEWVRTLRELEAMEGWTDFVGGHGIPVAPKSALTQRRRYMEALMQAVRDGMASGIRFDALYRSIELPEEFHAMRGYERHLERAAERIYHFYTMGW